MLDATFAHQLDDLLTCGCTTSPLAPEISKEALTDLLSELEMASAYPE